MNDLPPVNVLCLKWGRKYGSEYVNRLHRAVGRIMAFHGRPDIDEAIVGYRGKGVKIHLSCRPTPWLRDFWDV